VANRSGQTQNYLPNGSSSDALCRVNSSARFRDVHVVFETHAKFAPNINSRFIAEGHVGLEFGRVARTRYGHS